MLIRVPGVPAQRVPGPVSIVDAIPTLVGLLGEPALARFKQGTSGRDALAASRQDTGVFSQDTGRRRDAAYRYALTSERWKYFRIENREGPPGEELYDLHRDPHELEDVAAAHPEVAARLGAELQAQREAQQARARRLRGDVRPRLGEADPELLRELRALGYVAAGEEDAGE
jgi:arylsulfatase A-like enzyme